MSAFNDAELTFLNSRTRRLARVATASADAHPQVTPVGMWRYNPDTIDITGRNFVETRKFRNVANNPWAAVVIDDIASTDPWRPRAVIVEGAAEALGNPDEPDRGLIRIAADRVISWGLDDQNDDELTGPTPSASAE